MVTTAVLIYLQRFHCKLLHYKSHRYIAIMSSVSMAAVKREADDNIKLECAVSSGYNPIKSEETDDEDMCKDANTSNSHENHLLHINIKQEVKTEVKTEDEASTDDERCPECVVSSGYYPVKSEETDDEDTNSTSNENINIKDVATATSGKIGYAYKEVSRSSIVLAPRLNSRGRLLCLLQTPTKKRLKLKP